MFDLIKDFMLVNMQSLGVWKKLLTLLLCLKYSSCTIQLTHNTLVCGQAALLNCSVNPFVGIRWERNSVLLVSCYTDGDCDVPSLGNFGFSLVNSNYLLTIDPFSYSEYENDVFSCEDSKEAAVVTLDISVPLDIVTLNESSNVLTASTNCLKSGSVVTFNWTCVSPADSGVIYPKCNVTNITSATDATGCAAAGNNCLGTGLDKKTQVLNFENYSDPLTATTVKLVATATFGGITVTATSTNAFTIPVDVPTPSVVIEDPPECTFIWCGFGIMLGVGGIAILVGAVLFYMFYWKAKRPLHPDRRSSNNSQENGNVHLSEKDTRLSHNHDRKTTEHTGSR